MSIYLSGPWMDDHKLRGKSYSLISNKEAVFILIPYFFLHLILCYHIKPVLTSKRARKGFRTVFNVLLKANFNIDIKADLPTLKNTNSYFDIQKFVFCTKKSYFLKLISQNAFWTFILRIFHTVSECRKGCRIRQVHVSWLASVR